MVKGSVKYQDLVDQGMIITPKEDYEKAQVDMQILAFENQKYRHALEKIAQDPGRTASDAERYTQIAQWGLWNFSNATGKKYQTLDPSVAKRASAAFSLQEALKTDDNTQCENGSVVA
jgi:hypothetical protein